jgi:hypothetical protein
VLAAQPLAQHEGVLRADGDDEGQAGAEPGSQGEEVLMHIRNVASRPFQQSS